MVDEHRDEQQTKDTNAEADEQEQRGKFSEGIETLVDEVNKAVRVAIVRGANTAESLGENLKDTIQVVRSGSNRDNVVMVRIDSESLERVDELVEVGIVGSRSEAAAFLIGEGIKARQEIFDKINEKISEIRKAKDELRELLKEDIKASDSSASKSESSD